MNRNYDDIRIQFHLIYVENSFESVHPDYICESLQLIAIYCLFAIQRVLLLFKFTDSSLSRETHTAHC